MAKVAKARGGRPVKSRRSKAARFDTKMPKDQKEKFEYAASIGGYRTLTDFLISSAQEKADEIIRQHESFLSHEKDRELFFNVLSNPPQPGKNLIKAAEKLKSLLAAK
jgi:uncharacterized protein (DUF1778 family)